MYFHGTKQCAESPFAHKDKHTFWVYPASTPLTNKWDTHYSAEEYCSNHVDEGAPSNNPALQQYVCLGHTSREELEVAELEWSLHTKEEKNRVRINTIQHSNGTLTHYGTHALLELVKEQWKETATMQIRLETLEGKLKDSEAALQTHTEELEAKLKLKANAATNTRTEKAILTRLESLEMILEQQNEVSILKNRTEKELLARLEAIEASFEEAESEYESESEAEEAEVEPEPPKQFRYENTTTFLVFLFLRIIVYIVFYYYVFLAVREKLHTLQPYIDRSRQIESGFNHQSLLESPAP